MNLFDNKLAFLVLLTRFKGALIHPSDQAIASLAVQITHRVQARNQHAVLGWPERDIDTRVKQKGSTVSTMKGFGQNVLVRGKMRAAVSATVYNMTRAFQVNHGVVLALGSPSRELGGSVIQKESTSTGR